MATEITVWCPSAGAAWARLIGFYHDWCADTYDSIDAVPGTSGGLNTIQVTLALGADETDYTLLIASIETARAASLYEVMTSPGWRAQPSGTINISSKDVGTAFDAIIVPCKKALIEQLCGATITAESFGSAGGYVFENAYWNHWMWRVARLQEVAMDEMVLWETNFGDPVLVDEDMGPPTDGLIAGPGGSTIVGAASGGGAIDVDAIVAGLQDIALRDVDYSANNAATIFTMRGRVRVEA